MTVYKGLVKVETLAGKPTYVDVTREVADIVSQSGIKEGVVHCISCHTTCAVYSQEFDHDVTPAGDTFMQADLSDGLDRVFPVCLVNRAFHKKASVRFTSHHENSSRKSACPASPSS